MRVDISPIAHVLGALRHWGSNPNERHGALREEPIIGVSDTGDSVYWPTPSLAQAGHALCWGASGTGKSVLIGAAVAEEIGRGRTTLPPDEQPAALIIVPKRDMLLTFVQALAARAPEALINLAILRPFSATGFAFNLSRLPLNGTPLEIRAWQLANLVAEVSTNTGLLRSGSASAGARQIEVISGLLLGALSVNDPRANIVLAYDALETSQGLMRLGSIASSERARSFLLGLKLGDELAASCKARCRMALAATDGIERMLGSNGCISLPELCGPGQICLIDLSDPPGGFLGLQIFWSSLLSNLGIDHALARTSPFRGHHLRIIADEVQLLAGVLAERAEMLLTTGRSRNCSTILISQGTALIERAAPTLVSTLMTNCPTKLIGRLSAPDAELLSRELNPVPGNPERPKTMRERFAAAVSNLPDRRFYYLEPSRRTRFTSAPLDLARWERSAEEHQAAIAAAERRFALPATTPRRTTLAELTPHFDTGRAGGREGDRLPRSQWG